MCAQAVYKTQFPFLIISITTSPPHLHLLRYNFYFYFFLRVLVRFHIIYVPQLIIALVKRQPSNMHNFAAAAAESAEKRKISNGRSVHVGRNCGACESVMISSTMVSHLHEPCDFQRDLRSDCARVNVPFKLNEHAESGRAARRSVVALDIY